MELLDFNINEFDINNNYSISASAGTGKTYTIVQIVKKLIENNIKEDEIVIVTYTEKAAGELKIRIKKDIPHFDLDKAHIGTIHSFCKDVIDEYYFSMGLPSELILVDNKMKQDVYDKIIREYLYSNRISLDLIGDNQENLYVSKIVDKMYLDANGNIDPKIVSFPKLSDFDKVALEMKSLIGKSKEEVLDYFINFENEEDGTYVPFINSFFTKVKEEVQKGNEKMTKFFDDLFSNITNKGEFKYNGRSCAPDDTDANNKLKIIKGIGKETSFYKKISVDLYKRWQEVKHHNKWFTYDDMLREVREAVVCEGSELKEKLKRRYKYALIDEFQDTNSLQWDIFKNIFLYDEKNHITVVGDRKQSIYSFQGADLTVYDEAVKEIEASGGILKNLPNNYRSSSNMINAYNKLFEMDRFKSIEYDIPVGVGNPNFDAKIDGKSIKGIGVVSKKVEEKPEELKTVDPTEYAQVIVDIISDYCSIDKTGKTKLQIFDKDGNPHNVSFNDFMILARTRSEFTHVENALKKSGIPFVKFKDNNLFTGFECAHWIVLIDAILKEDFTGRNRNSFRKVLYTKFFNKSLQEISSPYYDTDSSEEMDLILKWKALAGEYKYTELINSIFQDSKIEQRMATLTDIQSLNVFKQIGDYALEYLLRGNTLYSLKNELINLSKNKDLNEDEGSSIVAKGTDFDCVELMTMHASKGLERGIVFVVGGEKEFNKKIKPVEIYHETGEDGTTRAYLTIDKNKYEKEKRDEIDRLFYVAYTRARYLLVIPYYEENKDISIIETTKQFLSEDKDNKYHENMFYDKSKISEENIRDKVNKIILTNTNKEEEKDDKENQLKILKDLSKNMNKHSIFKHSYASLSSVKENEEICGENLNADKEGEESEEILNRFDLSSKPAPLSYADIEPNIIPEGFPRGSKVGTTLHEIFELFDFNEIDKENNLSSIIDERFKCNRLENTLSYSQYVLNMVENVLYAYLPLIKGNNILLDKMFKLKDIRKEDRKVEMEFNFKFDENLSSYFNGFIDLVFKQGDYYSILDWKSDVINDEDLLSYNKGEDLKKRVDNHYSIQRVLYSYTLIHWLYSCGMAPTLEEVFNKHFGGIYYVFIRGCNKDTSNGIYAQTWDSYSELEQEFNKIMDEVKKMRIKGASLNGK